MSKFDKTLTEALADLLSQQGVESVSSKLRSARDATSAAEEEALTRVNQVLAHMAAEMRNLIPKMQATVTSRGCTYKYGSRSITVLPDFETGVWEVEPGSSPGDQRFFRRAMSDLQEVPLQEYDRLVQAIATRFVEGYKRLQGGKVALPEPTLTTSLPDEEIDSAMGDEDE